MAKGLTGIRVPDLDVDATRLVKDCTESLAAQFITMTPEVEQFITDLAGEMSLNDVSSFVYGLTRDDYQKVVTDIAKKNKLTAPTLKVDRAKVDADLKTTAASAGISFNASIRKFIDESLEAGASPSIVKSVLQSLNYATPQEAIDRQKWQLNRLNVTLKPPKVRYLKSSARELLTTGIKELPLADKDRAFDLMWALVQDGDNPPGKVVSAFQNLEYETNLKENLEGEDINIPASVDVPKHWRFDEAGVKAYLKNSSYLTGVIDAKWETYLDKALPRALKKSTFDFSELQYADKGDLQRLMKKWSGLKAPA